MQLFALCPCCKGFVRVMPLVEARSVAGAAMSAKKRD
jgi:hypothetical protein